MRLYIRLMGIREGMSILDLGGLPGIWQSVSERLDLTLLNLPGSVDRDLSSHHTIRYVEGDACCVAEFGERAFDTVFSNSVIEHVGSVENQEAFAAEVRRLGKSYWVQTPAKWFPIEAHCGMPLWWFYPHWLRNRLLKSWRRKLPEWTKWWKPRRYSEGNVWNDFFRKRPSLPRGSSASLSLTSRTSVERNRGRTARFVR